MMLGSQRNLARAVSFTGIVLSAFMVISAAGHGGLVLPPARNNYGNVSPMNFTKQPGSIYYPGGPCAGDMCLWFNEGCFIGCPACSNNMPGAGPHAGQAQGNYFGSPNCNTSEGLMEPTLPDAFRTYNLRNQSSWGDWSKYHPWRAPGHAPVSDPCGRAGGYANTRGGGGQTPMGAKQFDRGSKLAKLDGVRTEWLAGDVAEVGWMVGANHGGGYQYSLCPAGEALTEACFQAHVLPFVGGNTTIRYLDGRGQRLIAAMDVTEGTRPAGSAWRRNPIPACNCDGGDGCKGTAAGNEDGRQSYEDGQQPVPKGFDCPTGTQFAVPFDYGYGQHVWNNPKPPSPAALTWVMVDRVRVPAVRGEYVLRWRWDAEQNPQIWTHCADVVVV